MYQVSNFGRVKSKDRYLYRDDKGRTHKIHKKEALLKQYVRNKYYAVKLYKNDIPKNYSVHRLVLETFIENVNNKPCINHKDGNKLNNKLDNLEWCTYSENTTHAYLNGLEKTTNKQRETARKNQKRAIEKTSKPVIQYSLDGIYITEWDSIGKANKAFRKKSYKN